MYTLVWRLWPPAKIFTNITSRDIVKDYEEAIRSGANLLPATDFEKYVAEQAYKEQGPLLNPEQDVSNTEIDESYEPGRE